MLNRNTFVLLCGLLWAVAASGQSDYLSQAGSPPSATNLPISGGGVVNITNGNLHIEIPITNPQQRGSLPVNARLIYDSRIWGINDVNGVYEWQPNNISQTHDYFASPSGWRFVIGQEQNDYWVLETFNGCQETLQFGFTDSIGTVHNFPFETAAGCSPSQNAQGFATDSSGYFGVATNTHNLAVYDSQGNQVTPTFSSDCFPNCGLDSIPYDSVDTNGNYTSTDSNGNFIDTLGLSPVVYSTSRNTATYQVLIPGGNRVNYTITFALIPYNTSFNQSGVSDVQGSMEAIQSILLPDGSSYSFNYDLNYGELTSMTLPQGGTVNFGWTTYFDSYNNANRWLASSQLGSAPATTYAPQVISQCSQNGTGCQEQVTVTKPSGDQSVYTMTINNGSWNTETQYYNGSVNPNNLLVTDTATENFKSTTDPTCVSLQPCQPLNWSAGQTNTRQFPTGDSTTSQSSSNIPWTGLTTTVQQWDFGVPTSGAPTKQTVYQYQAGPNQSQLLQSATLEDGNSNPISQTSYGYDESSLSNCPAGISQHEAVSGARGNLTSISTGSVTLGGISKTTYTYDQCGALQSEVSPDGNDTGPANSYQTNYQYDPTDTYITQTNLPSTNGITHVTTATFDQYTGAITTSNDENSVANGNVYSLNYQYDSIGRLSEISRSGPDGGQTVYSYPSSTEVDVAVQQSPGVSVTTQNVSDSFGRPLSSTQNGIISSISYDNNGRVYCRYHAASTSGGSSTDGSECTTYDGLDRVNLITHYPSGTTVTSDYAFNGQSILVIDELNHQKTYKLDGFGRTVSVTEPTGYLTAYTYDLMDNLIRIDQEGNQQGNQSQWRTYQWSYDPRGRLVYKTSPEAGTTCYGTVSGSSCNEQYDADGNALGTTDQLGNYLQYGYDYLDRMTSMTATPSGSCGSCVPETFTYTYDAAAAGNHFQPTNSRGLLVTGMISANSAVRLTNFGYNTRGELVTQVTCLTTACSSPVDQVTAVYDQASNLTYVTYPDQRTIQNAYDLSNRLNSVSYSKWQGQPISGNPPYWNNSSYTPTGRLTGAQYGSGLLLSAQYDSHSQFSSLQYGVAGQSPIWSKTYTWDVNAKNLTAITDTVFSTKRQFIYDTLDRLTSAVDYSTSSTPGTGTATVSGSEGTHLVCGGGAMVSSQTSSTTQSLGGVKPAAGPGCQRFTDSGTVTITVNGYEATYYFGQSDTSATVAAGLNTALNATNSPVTATLQGSTTIVMTSKTTGQGADYAISWSGTTDGVSQDFTVSLSGSTLTGGSNGGPLNNGMSETYAYDPWGNLTKSGNYTFSPMSFGTNNRVNDGSVGYDANGNIQSDNLNHQFSYSTLNQLASASNGAMSFTYDAFGNRVGISSGGSNTDLVYFGGQLLAVNATNGWTDLVYANEQVIADVPGSQTASPTYRILNHLGSVEGVVDNSNSWSGTADYFPDGRTFLSSLPTPFGFTGLYGGSPGDTSHADSRELFGTEGRWLSPDPAGSSFHIDDPQSFNRYGYVRGSMLALSDRSGLDVECGSVCIGVGDGLAGLCFIFCGGGPTGHFTGSMIRRANAGKVWEENGTQIAGIPNPGIGSLINLPQTGCEFGACSPPEPLGLASGVGSSSSGSVLLSVVNSAALFFGPLYQQLHQCQEGNCKYKIYYGPAPIFGNYCSANHKPDGTPADPYSLWDCIGDLAACKANARSFQDACSAQGQVPLDCDQGVTVENGQFYVCPCCSFGKLPQ